MDMQYLIESVTWLKRRTGNRQIAELPFNNNKSFVLLASIYEVSAISLHCLYMLIYFSLC